MTAEQAVKSVVAQISGNIALVNVPGHLPQFVALRNLTKVQPE